uniref:MSP domain-containing protein n=1 Tax=Steinernema glaseri TaxID=37863 RepID=A0A1I8ANG5_9BILA
MENAPILSDVLHPLKVGRNVVRFEPPLLGTPVIKVRLFGGESLAVMQVAVECLYPANEVLSIRTCFVSPGTIKDPLFCTVDRVPGTPFINATVEQNNKTIATGRIKIGFSEDSLTHTSFKKPDVEEPSSYISMLEALRTTADNTAGQYLSELVKWGLFDVRPVDLDQALMVKKEGKPFRVWSSATEVQKRRGLERVSGKAVLLLLTDFWAMQSSKENFEKYEEGNVVIPASMNQTVTYHNEGKIDPCGWFLTETECRVHSCNRFFTEGKIFDETGNCVLSFQQEGWRP